MRLLSTLKIGEWGIIDNISPDCSLYRRLLDLGLVPGTKISCVLKSPLGDPVAYFVRGALIAIRCEDSQNIILQ